MLLIITSTGDLEWCWALKILVFSDFLVLFGCKRVNCDEMDGDGPRLLANRNCYSLSRVSWALAQVSCLLWACIGDREANMQALYCAGWLHNNVDIVVLYRACSESRSKERRAGCEDDNCGQSQADSCCCCYGASYWHGRSTTHCESTTTTLSTLWAVKKRATLLWSMSLPIIDQFSKFFLAVMWLL